MTGHNSKSTSEKSGTDRLRLFHPLASRNFRLLWLGESISTLGNHSEGLALSWVILDVLGLQLVFLALAGWLVEMNQMLMFGGAGALIVLAGFTLATDVKVRSID
jgi:hypothetical protein